MKKLIALTLSVTMILSLSACGKKEQIPSNNASNNSDNTGKTYSIDIGHGGAESTAQQVGCLALKDYLENNSNGVFTVNVYPSNSVGSDDELCQMVQNGNIAMCLANSVILNYVPDAAIYDLFMRFNNIDDVKAKYTEDENFLAVMREKYAKANFYLGGFSVHGFRQTTANKPIYSPEDLKGLTFRVMQNDLHIQGWQCMGATPTPFAFNELYTALQQGTVDAQENPIELIYSQKFYEQQKYITLTNHLQQTQQWLVNLDLTKIKRSWMLVLLLRPKLLPITRLKTKLPGRKRSKITVALSLTLRMLSARSSVKQWLLSGMPYRNAFPLTFGMPTSIRQ